MRPLIARTVWAPGALRDVPDRFQPIIRWVLPVMYGLNLLLFGFYGAFQGGSRLMQQYLPYPGATILSALIGFAGLLALAGLAMRRLAIERTGAVLLSAASVVYLILLIVALATSDGGTPLATITAFGVFIALTVFRVLDLSREIGKRRRQNLRS